MMSFVNQRPRLEVGKLGEDLVCEFLAKRGYRIMYRNYRKPWGEIDIVARARDGTLVFVEVKALSGVQGSSLVPEDNLTAAKLKKLRRTCDGFVQKNPKWVREDRGWQIDLVAVDLEGERAREVRHYENL